MDLFEFQEAVKKGEINDFEPYMHKQKFDVRRKILIEQGLATERYESWKNHPSKHVREALAKQGYYPDLYINDKSPDVRKHIIYQYPKQSLKRMHNHNDRFAIRWELVREPNPDLEVLSAFLETVTKSELKEAFALNDIEALRLKHQALITNLSPIEKTMAPYQLFEIHNPLWTLHYTAIAVFNITNAYDELEPEYKQMDNCVKLMFEIKDQLINAHASNLRAALRRRLGERN